MDYDAWLMSGPGGPHDDTPWCETCGLDYEDCTCEEEDDDHDTDAGEDANIHVYHGDV